MDKEKLIKGGMWLSGFSLSIMLSAMSLFAGFNNIRFGSYTMLIIGLLLIIQIFLGILTLLNDAQIFLSSMHQITSIFLVTSTIYFLYLNNNSN